MYPQNFKRLLVGLDLSDMDDLLIRYALTVAGWLQIEKVYFLHIIPDLQQPTIDGPGFYTLFNPEIPLDEQIEHQIQARVQGIWKQQAAPIYTVDVVEGKPYQQMVHWATIKNADLVMVGCKTQSAGSGITARRMARQIKSSVLFVPEDTELKPAKMAVPFDFSKNAARAIKTALHLSQKTGASVMGLHVVEVLPPDYTITLVRQAEYTGVLLQNAKEAYQEFIQKYAVDPADLQVDFVENTFYNIAAHIRHYVAEINAGLLVMGAQGHSAWENFWFGSVTERLVEEKPACPVLVVR